MWQKRSDHKRINETERPKRKIRELLIEIVLFAALIFDTVFRKQDYDTVFDSGGKVAIIVLMLLFFVIYYIQYIQLEKNDKE